MSDDLIPNQILFLVSFFGGLLCIYLSNIPLMGGILSIAGISLATIFGINALRHVGKYSLGTGVPSIVYLLTAIGVIGYLLGIVLTINLNQPILFPIIAIISAIVLALIVSYICKYLFGIQVDILAKSFISISLASVLLIISMSTLISQTFIPQVIYENVIQNGIIILLMLMSVMVIQNPYNACMGPNEDQYRTLSLGLTNIFLMLIVLSLLCIFTSKYWILYLLLSIIGWIISFRKYIGYTKHQVASIKRYGLWPKDDKEI